MTSIEWNTQHPIGTKVVLTLANGKRRVTRTASQAETWGSRHHVRVEAIESGYVLLEWVRPFHEIAGYAAERHPRHRPGGESCPTVLIVNTAPVDSIRPVGVGTRYDLDRAQNELSTT